MEDYYVYMLSREDGRPFYIGKGKGRRCEVHGYVDRKSRSKRASIIRRMQGAGIRVPTTKLASGLTETEAFRLEREFIAKIGREPNGPLVNQTDGGEGTSGRVVSAAVREAIALKHRGRKRGRTITEAGVAALRLKLTGSKRTPEQRALMSERQRGNKKNLGKTRSPETREKIAAGHRGKRLSESSIAKRQAKRAFATKARVNWFWKICRDCRQEKPLGLLFWGPSKKSADRQSYSCRACAQEHDRRRYATKVGKLRADIQPLR